MHVDDQYDARDASKLGEDKDRQIVIEVLGGEVLRVYVKTSFWLNVKVVHMDTLEVETMHTMPPDVMHPEVKAALRA